MTPFPMPDLLPALPEIFLVVMVSILLIADLFVGDDRRGVGYALALLSLAGAALITLLTATGTPVYTFSAHVRGRPDGGRAEARASTPPSPRCSSIPGSTCECAACSAASSSPSRSSRRSA